MDTRNPLLQFVFFYFGNKHHKFIATGAIDFAIMENALQNRRSRLQHFVAGTMPLDIIHAFQAVQVGKEHRQRHRFLPGDNLIDVIVHHIPVLDAR